MAQNKPLTEDQAKAIRDYVSKSQGQRKLAETMALPLRSRMNMQSVAKKAFQVEEIPPDPCGSCGQRDYSAGHAAGCRECAVRSVMGT